MSTLLIRRASTFLQDKYRAATMTFINVSEAELLVEKVTDDNPWCPDVKSMNQIAEASYDFEDYWRIVDILHKRFYEVNKKKWRQSYNSLILLEFLIINGPTEFAVEFKSDVNVFKELGTFQHEDENGVDWGFYMRTKSSRILKLMQGGPSLEEVRSKSIKLSKEIQGFGSSSSPSSSSSSPWSSSSSSSPQNSWRSSFDSNSTSSPSWNHTMANDQNKHDYDHMKQQFLEHDKMPKNFLNDGMIKNDILDWNSIDLDSFTEINLNDECEANKNNNNNNNKTKKVGFLQGIATKKFGYSPLKISGEKLLSKSLSDIGIGLEKTKKVFDHYSSLGN